MVAESRDHDMMQTVYERTVRTVAIFLKFSCNNFGCCLYLEPCIQLMCLIPVNSCILTVFVFSGSSCVLKWEDPHDSVVYCVDSDNKWMVISGTNRYGVVCYILIDMSGSGRGQDE